MDRRKAIKLTAGVIAGGGAGLLTLTNAFKPDYLKLEDSKKIENNNSKTSWDYHPLDPTMSADIAYEIYDSGSCMYATFRSIISQLSEKYGEPYSSFPLHMMKYGHGGIGGFGTICGALNGAGAAIGLFIADKTAQDNLINGLFKWYEETALPEFKPKKAILDFTPPLSVSNSPLCHASNTNWVKESGYRVNSDQRKERCRRLTSDVAYRVTLALNEYFGNTYLTTGGENKNTRTCITCHGDNGKIGNTSSKMNCGSCHTESTGHKVFADIHYKLMKERK
ncbi:MAG TPA: C-GCAxxG-C-C family protein [Bacteroidales bacterium]|nr:C-GCAxxG-C-C family protein [Bacteroidales bacterium]